MADGYTSGQINFTGLGNGTDFNTLVEGLVKAERYHITRLETWKASWEAKMDSFKSLNTKLLALKTSLEGMDTMNEFLTKDTSTSDENVLTVSTDSSAEEGTHSILVNQLAQNKIMAHQTGYDATTSIINSSGGALVFQYSYKGVTRSLSVPDDTTLEGLKNIINSDPDNRGVRAAVISNGEKYFLQFRGLDLGADATLTIGGGTTVVGFGAATWGTTQTNQNSLIRVDGWPATTWISNASNTVTGIIEGLTLNLKGTSASAVRLTTDTDNEAVKENVRTFVSQLNEVRTMILDLTKVNTTGDTPQGSILTGNYGVDMISQNLKNITASKGIGFISYNSLGIPEDTIAALSQVGITTDADEGSATNGLLVLDEEVLDEALEADPDAVAKIFAANYEGESKSTSFSYLSHIQGVTDAGEFRVRVTVNGAGTAITSATINGHAASISGWEITGAAGQPEAGLAIRLDNRTAGSTQEGTVAIKLGKAGELIDELKELTNSSTGPLHILEENYTDITDSIDDKIAYEERRISNMQAFLKQKFARLDALLGTYDQKTQQLAAAIKQMTTS